MPFGVPDWSAMSPRFRRVLGVVVPLVLLLVVTLASRSGSDGDADADARIVAGSSDTSISIDLDGSGSDTTDASPSDDTTDDTGDDTVDTATATTESVDDGRNCVDGDVDTIDVSDLPDEALDTIALIESGGPFPYDQDDATFQNREQLLPQHERGYYHEYTVETPGSDDRGARRIVTGECGERWYTYDHYDSFALILGSA